MDGKIFEADVGSCIRSVPGLKPSQHEIDEIKAYMDRGGTVLRRTAFIQIQLILSGVIYVVRLENYVLYIIASSQK